MKHHALVDGIKKHKAWSITLAIVVVALLALAIKFLVSGTTQDGGVYVQSVRDVNLAAGVGDTNRFSGVIESQRTQKVTLDSSRTVDKVKVSVGDHVKKGDVLFTYNTDTIRLQIEQAQIEIERFETSIANASSQIDTLQKSMNGASSEEKLDYSAQIQELQAQMAQDEYDKKTKEAEMEQLKKSIEDPGVHAQIDGTVEAVGTIPTTNPQLGSNGEGDDAPPEAQEGTSQDGSGEGDAFITILADGDLRVKATTTEQNIAEISEGLSVIVRSRVDSNVTWKGTVASLASKPTEADSSEMMGEGSSSDNAASNYSFYVTLDSTDGLILGQHVTVEPDYGQGDVKSGIWLDGGWIVTEDDGSTYVWATSTKGGTLQKRSVTLGEHDEALNEYQISAGLAESDYLAWPDEDCVEGAPTTTTLPAEAPQGLQGSDSVDGTWSVGSGDVGSGVAMPEGDGMGSVALKGGSADAGA